VTCSWCDHAATTYLIPDSGTRPLDTACASHAVVWAHLYRRAVPIAKALEPAGRRLELTPV